MADEVRGNGLGSPQELVTFPSRNPLVLQAGLMDTSYPYRTWMDYLPAPVPIDPNLLSHGLLPGTRPQVPVVPRVTVPAPVAIPQKPVQPTIPANVGSVQVPLSLPPQTQAQTSTQETNPSLGSSFLELISNLLRVQNPVNTMAIPDTTIAAQMENEFDYPEDSTVNINEGVPYLSLLDAIYKALYQANNIPYPG